MWKYSTGNHVNVVLYVCLFLFANILNSIEPLLVGLIFNTIQTYGIEATNLYYILGLFGLILIIEIIFWAFHGPARIIENKNAFIVRANYKRYLLEGTMALPMEWHTDHHSGDTIDKIEKGTTALFGFSERTFEILQVAISLLISCVVLFYYSKSSFAISAGLIVTAFYTMVLFDRRLVPGYKRVNGIENAVSAKVFDTISNITTIIILRVESLVLTSLNTFVYKPFGQYKINARLNEWKWFSASILARLAAILVVIIYIVSNISFGGILVGTIYILYGYGKQIGENFYRFAYLYNDIVRYRATVSNSEELSRDFRINSLSADKHLPSSWSTIEIRGLSFSYHTSKGDDLHLDDINMRILKGERLALIGESGGGKSTFLKIIRDLYHPKTLDLTVDDHPIAGGFAAISDSVSLVPQDPEIFATTIRENITLGADYTDLHIKVFTDMARFSSVADGLPRGLESSIVEKGVNLSGGEKQRLALTRGLLASEHKGIILLDEPTSSVDFQNELDIYKNIFDAFPSKTIISSIHRLHLLSLFDKIYLFKEGRVVASGSYEELQNSSSDFKMLWEKYIKTRDANSE